jgi:hypothetical protein
MAYEPGTYSQELRQEHEEGGHPGGWEEHPNCPICIFDDEEDAPRLNEEIMASAVAMDKTTAEHARHSPAKRPDECLACAIGVDR